MRSRRLRSALIGSAALFVFALPAAAHDHIIVGGEGVVTGTNGDGVNVRSEPGLNSEVEMVASEGTTLRVTSGPHEADGSAWYGVHLDGVDAWIVGDFLDDAPSQAGGAVQVVQTDGHGLRLRSDASLDAETLTVIPEGASLDVVGAEKTDESGASWANVSYNGHTGYAHRDYLIVAGSVGSAVEATHEHFEEESEPANPGGIAVGSNVQIVNTDGDGLNVRHGAGYGHSVASVAEEGHVAHVIGGPEVDGEGTHWWNVDYRGHSGWVHGDYLQVTDQEVTSPGSASEASDSGSDEAPAGSELGQQLVNEAMQYLGHPYVWGGTTPSGFDCSGFIYYVVNQVTGGGFPRSMASHVNAGVHVPADQLQPGDLVFQQNTYQWGLSHAGIYIGDGQFVHAASPGSGVIVSDLWDSYWGQRYYTARRLS